MKYLNTIFILALLLAMGCSDESIEVDQQIPNEKMAPPTRTKTIKFRESSGIMEYIPGASYCNQFGGGMLLKITGSGKASVLGNFSVINEVCLDMDTGTPISLFLGTLKAKNGDQINTQLLGEYVDPNDPNVNVYDYKVLGGTGRFQKITGGSITMFGQVDYTNNVWSLQGEGTLIY